MISWEHPFFRNVRVYLTGSQSAYCRLSMLEELDEASYQYALHLTVLPAINFIRSDESVGGPDGDSDKKSSAWETSHLGTEAGCN
jgi:hypothetical protein